MKILVVCQYYKPEPFRISDICEELARLGHEIQVVTGYPNYPEGILYDGYGRGKKTEEVLEGVKVHRCYTVPRGQGTFKRVLNYYSYMVSAKRYVLSNKCVSFDKKPFDIVFCYQLSPVMAANVAAAYKKKYKVPIVMYCLDLWPESLTVGGIKRKSAVYKYYHYISKRIYRGMDKILITSYMFADYFVDEFGFDKEKLEYLPQYAEDIFGTIEAKEGKDIFDFMFAGNVGLAQSVETILNAAEKLGNFPVRFHIVGGGSDLERLQTIKKEKELNNVLFYGRKSLEEMPEFYSMADAMLVTLSAESFLSLTLPGKVQSYMAAGKPIIAAINGETKDIIQAAECGYCGEAENVEELVENIKKFIDNKDRAALGKNARMFYEKRFTKDRFMENLEKHLLVTVI